MEAYRLALEMKADFVEMDIHMLRDGVLVAIHDPDVKRTTNGKGLLCELTLAELKALDAGSWFNRTYPRKARREYVGLKVPTLEEVIDFVKGSWNPPCCPSSITAKWKSAPGSFRSARSRSERSKHWIPRFKQGS